MNHRIRAIIGILMVAAIVVGGSWAGFNNTPMVEAVPSQSTMVRGLTILSTMSYAAWSSTGAYNQLRDSSAYDWMDWSQDGCSGPERIHSAYGSEFLLGCLRHDLLWRSMAVADRADGSVWNERNRLFVDKRFHSDHHDYCDAALSGFDNIIDRTLCKRASDSYYGVIRLAYRVNATDAENNSVNPSHSAYYRGVRLTSAQNCGYAANPTNRCLPINYITYEGKPLAPHKNALFPVGAVLEMEVVRANQQSRSGPPATSRPALHGGHTKKNTGELRIEVQSPFIVGKTANLNCSASPQRLTYADLSTMPVRTVDASIKRTPIYLKACRATTSSQERGKQIELHPMKGRRTYSGYEVNAQLLRVRDYSFVNAENSPISLTPSISSLGIRTAETWYGPVTIRTSSEYDDLTLYANPDDDSPLVEVSTGGTGSNFCRNGAETDDDFRLRNGDTFHIAMCGTGTGQIEVRDRASGLLLSQYSVSLGSGGGTIVETSCSVTTLRTGSRTVRGSWSTSDCFSTYRSGGYVDYYTYTPTVAQSVTFQLDSSTDPYLVLYSGGNTVDHYLDHNDDAPGIGTNSRITRSLSANTTYYIGVTTFGTTATGSYTLRVTAATQAVVRPLVPSGLTARAGNGTATLSWNAATGATGYQIQQWNDQRSRWDILRSSAYTLQSNGRGATVPNLVNGAYYYFQVRGTNASYQSAWSSNVVVQPTVTLARATGLTGTGGSRVVVLTWNAVPNAMGYDVHQWNPTIRAWQLLPFGTYTVNVSGNAAVVRGLLRGTTYYHQVRATNGLLYAPWHSGWSTTPTNP